MKERLFHTMMREICKEIGVKLQKIGTKILKLEYNGRVKLVYDNLFEYSSGTATQITRDKSSTFDLLYSENVPVVRHERIYKPDYIFAKNNQDIDKLLPSLLEKYGKIVLKPNTGRCARSTFLCNDIKEAKAALKKVFEDCKVASVSPFYKIKAEYRNAYFDGQVHFIEGDEKPIIIGDGKTSIKHFLELLNIKNEDIISDNLDFDKVLALGEELNVVWKYNNTSEIESVLLKQQCELYKRIETIALACANAMKIDLATIDIIHTDNDELYVIEVNSNIGIPKKLYAQEVYKEFLKKVLLKMFRVM